ncbi:MAG TPA: adenosylmethionine decarboxylase [Aquella sp.]|nr:adenosylmethionine decarboxylase [Aquella sp.]
MIGNHILLDLYGVETDLLKDSDLLMGILEKSLLKNGFTILNNISYKFPNGGEGVTGVFLLTESHAAFHTYPEYNYIAIDLFSCGQKKPGHIIYTIIKMLKPTNFNKKVNKRGVNCTLVIP